MGRGLSNLQKWILLKAYENWKSEDWDNLIKENWWTYPQSPFPSQLSKAEILNEYYGFEMRKDHPSPLARDIRENSGDGWHNFSMIYHDRLFDRKVIGYKKYHSKQQCIIQAIERLHRRKLLASAYKAVALTQLGIEKAKELMAVNRNNVTIDSQ